MMKKINLNIEYEDNGQSDLSYSFNGTEKTVLELKNGMAILYCNRSACKVFAEIFAKLAFGKYASGFHIHLEENFDFDKNETICICLTE